MRDVFQIAEMNNIHHTAIVHTKAEIDADVSIGPYSTIGEHVRIKRGVRIGSHVVIEGWTEIGENSNIFHSSIIGTIPQDLKFKGEESKIIIGDRNTFREFVTVNRGTAEEMKVTRIGDDNLFMAYVHIAHDCEIGNNIIMANAATLAGHIKIGDYAIVGGLVGIHQFVNIGIYSMIGGCSAVAQDVPPYMSAVGNRARLYGINMIGLKRHGFGREKIDRLKRSYKILFRSNYTLKNAIKKVRDEFKDCQEVENLLTFVENSKRGICR
ncbi:MAG: acyl-ACP--UDP-N-acetylglucosamine O-acyltransferase [Nitrospirota bacterium]